MKTLTLQEAAHFLHMHPEVLRREAKAQRIPGIKIGKKWLFIDIDLVEFMRTLYADHWQALRVTVRKEVTNCHSQNAVMSGGSTSLLQMDNEYSDLLGLVKKPKLRNITTS